MVALMDVLAASVLTKSGRVLGVVAFLVLFAVVSVVVLAALVAGYAGWEKFSRWSERLRVGEMAVLYAVLLVVFTFGYIVSAGFLQLAAVIAAGVLIASRWWARNYA